MFKMGQIVMTRGVADLVEKDQDFSKFVIKCLQRHRNSDWGDLCEEDKKENDFSVDKRLRILSAYKFNDDVKIWIITEADRSVTTVLFPDEY